MKKELILKDKTIYSYQTGVDVLGFPTFEEHALYEVFEVEHSTKFAGKNLSKPKQSWTEKHFWFRRTAKQF